MKRLIIYGATALVSIIIILIALFTYTLYSIEYRGAEMGQMDIASFSIPMTIKLYNPSPVPLVMDKVEVISTWKGAHFADATFKNLYIPANKESQHSSYLVIDKGIVQGLILKGLSEAFQGKTPTFDSNGMTATVTIKTNVLGFIPLERTDELRRQS